jgi:hypothetical protein
MPDYFEVAQPSMAMNDVRTPPNYLQFANTRRVEETDDVYELFQNAASVMAAWQKNGTTNISLAINCHGLVDSDEHGSFVGLQLGTGLNSDTVASVQAIQPYVQTIYLLACYSASGSSGDIFCSKLASLARAFVFASDTSQGADRGVPTQVPFGYVPAYHGNIKQYSKQGQVIYNGPWQGATIHQKGYWEQ